MSNTAWFKKYLVIYFTILLLIIILLKPFEFIRAILLVYIFFLPGLLFLLIENIEVDYIELITLSIMVSFAINIIWFYLCSLFNIEFLNIKSILLLNTASILTICTYIKLVKKKARLKIKHLKLKTITILSILFITYSLIASVPISGIGTEKPALLFPVGDDPKTHIVLIKDLISSKKIPIFDKFFGKINTAYTIGMHIILSEAIILANTTNVATSLVVFNIISGILQYISVYLFIGTFAKSNERIKYTILATFINLLVIREIRWYCIPENLALSFMLLSITYFKKIRNPVTTSLLIAATILTNGYVGILTTLYFVISAITEIFRYSLINRLILRFYLKRFLIVSFFIFPYIYFSLDTSQKMTVDEFQITVMKNSAISSSESFLISLKSLPINMIIDPIKEVGYIGSCTIMFILLVLLQRSKFMLQKDKEVNILFLSAIITIIFSFLISFITVTIGSHFSKTDLFVIARVFTPKRFLYLLYLPSMLLFISTLNYVKNRKTIIIIVVAIMIFTLFARISENHDLKVIYFTPSESEFINFIEKNLDLKNGETIWNDWSHSTSTTWIYPLTGKQTLCPYLPLSNVSKVYCTSGSSSQFIFRVIPDSEFAIKEIEKKNIKYITFTTTSMDWSKADLPQFDISKFTKKMYIPLYSNGDIYIFKARKNPKPTYYLTILNLSTTEIYNLLEPNRYGKHYYKRVLNISDINAVETLNMGFEINISDIAIDPITKDVLDAYLVIRAFPDGLPTRIEYCYEYNNACNSVIFFKESYENTSIFIMKLPNTIFTKSGSKFSIWFLDKKIDIANILILLRLPDSTVGLSKNVYLIPLNNSETYLSSIIVQPIDENEITVFISGDNKNPSIVYYKYDTGFMKLNAKNIVSDYRNNVSIIRCTFNSSNIHLMSFLTNASPGMIEDVVMINATKNKIIEVKNEDTTKCMLPNEIVKMGREIYFSNQWNLKERHFYMHSRNKNYKIATTHKCIKISIVLNCSNCIDINTLNNSKWVNIVPFAEQNETTDLIIMNPSTMTCIGIYPYRDIEGNISLAPC